MRVNFVLGGRTLAQTLNNQIWYDTSKLSSSQWVALLCLIRSIYNFFEELFLLVYECFEFPISNNHCWDFLLRETCLQWQLFFVHCTPGSLANEVVAERNRIFSNGSNRRLIVFLTLFYLSWQVSSLCRSNEIIWNLERRQMSSWMLVSALHSRRQETAIKP